ncbi:hypothetical protein B0H13DRAFT_1897167 [Mycena leptocephala]|nr:hypothetical protein B0H13DRAFT_1897167 [Mycena leptocephala]
MLPRPPLHFFLLYTRCLFVPLIDYVQEVLEERSVFRMQWKTLNSETSPYLDRGEFIPRIQHNPLGWLASPCKWVTRIPVISESVNSSSAEGIDMGLGRIFIDSSPGHEGWYPDERVLMEHGSYH